DTRFSVEPTIGPPVTAGPCAVATRAHAALDRRRYSAWPATIRVKPAPPALTSCAQPSDATFGRVCRPDMVRSTRLDAFRTVACGSILEHPPARLGPMKQLSGGRLRGEVLVLGDELAGDEARPLRVVDHRQPGPWGVERSGDDLATEFAHLRRCGGHVVDCEG